MVSLEDIVVRIANPRNRRDDREANDDVRYHSHGDDCIVDVRVVNEQYNYPKYKPNESRNSTSRVDTAELLKGRCACQTESKRGPLCK